ncbi:hypothetical protein T11_10611 [Trichinella zimbabwensis]|uniref:Uncharacterized protein n=1 Tax=Trichinella zimbabwensis TaxID=268475 RepID=A0A0V1H562_9BILA|nr:hypothetical protein T11_10611 [Trichinella zimbabwensis]
MIWHDYIPFLLGHFKQAPITSFATNKPSSVFVHFHQMHQLSPFFKNLNRTNAISNSINEQYLTMTCKKRNHCFVSKLLSRDVHIIEKNILAQDTRSNFFPEIT